MGSNIDLKVAPEKLRSTAASVTSLVSTLRGDFESIQERVAKTANYWIGPAGDEFRKEFASLKIDSQDLLETLGKYPRDLLEMAQVYESAEKAVTHSSEALPSDIIEES